MEVSRTSTQTTVACKFKMFQNTNSGNAWEINIDWTSPTVTPTPGLMAKKDIEHRTLRLVSLHYACETSANPCTLKEFLRLKFKIMTKANYDEFMTAVNKFKSQIKAENFDPTIISKIHVLQSHNHATHSTKT